MIVACSLGRYAATTVATRGRSSVSTGRFSGGSGNRKARAVSMAMRSAVTNRAENSTQNHSSSAASAGDHATRT
jgi:hypothetical protein